MTSVEKSLLADLCVKYSTIIENKKTDAFTVKNKEDANLPLAKLYKGSKRLTYNTERE